MRGQRHAPAALYPRERPDTHCTGGCVAPKGRSGQVRKILPPPGFDPRTVQHVASRYTNYATRHAMGNRCLITTKKIMFLHLLHNTKYRTRNIFSSLVHCRQLKKNTFIGLRLLLKRYIKRGIYGSNCRTRSRKIPLDICIYNLSYPWNIIKFTKINIVVTSRKILRRKHSLLCFSPLIKQRNEIQSNTSTVYNKKKYSEPNIPHRTNTKRGQEQTRTPSAYI